MCVYISMAHASPLPTTQQYPTHFLSKHPPPQKKIYPTKRRSHLLQHLAVEPALASIGGVPLSPTSAARARFFVGAADGKGKKGKKDGDKGGGSGGGGQSSSQEGAGGGGGGLASWLVRRLTLSGPAAPAPAVSEAVEEQQGVPLPQLPSPVGVDKVGEGEFVGGEEEEEGDEVGWGGVGKGGERKRGESVVMTV